MPDADGKLDDIALGWDNPTRYEVRREGKGCFLFFEERGGDDDAIEEKTSESAKPKGLALPFLSQLVPKKTQTRPPLPPPLFLFHQSPATNSPMFGVVVGRLINRIANASYELNGKTHELAPNDEHGSALHGGAGLGWAHRKWELTNSTADSVTYSLKSPDGDQKFPGALDVSVTYLLKNDSLKMTMVVAAEETNKEATPVNIAQHSYFNLDGHAAGPRAIKNLRTTIDASHRAVLKTDGSALPTGAVEAVAGGPFDFRSEGKAGRALGDSWNATTDPEPGLGYEVMFVTGNKTLAQAKSSTTKPGKLNKNSAKKDPVGCSVTRDGSPIRAARFVSPCSGRTLEAWTSAPAFEIYTGNHLDPKGLIGKGEQGFFFLFLF